MNYKEFNFWCKDNILNDNMFDENGNVITNNAQNYKTTGLIAEIFEDHWKNYYSKYGNKIDKIRPDCNETVLKMLDCHNHNLGASIFHCPHCNKLYFSHHTCKSKFCTSCGAKTQKIIANNILNHCYRCKHRQIVFTIPDFLRPIFFNNFRTLNILFLAVRDTLYSIVNGKVPKKKRSRKRKHHTSKQIFTPGFFSFLHTYGRGINWNPHIHVLIAEMVLGDIDVFKKFEYFNYNALSFRFQKILLDKLEAYFGKKKFRSIKNRCYSQCKKGFYVYAEPKKFDSPIDGIMYMARYGSHPAISENRIINYDGENVTYWYNHHKDNSYIEVTVPVYSFITSLIQHISPKGFKMARYYGFYNKKHKYHDKIVMLISNELASFNKHLLKWNVSILRKFNRNPLECPKCGHSMKYLFELERLVT